MEIHIGNRVADVTLVSKEGNKVRLSIDGKPYDVDIVMTENGSCSVLHDGNSFNAEIISGEDHRSYDVNMFYRSYHVDIVDTQTKYLRMKKGGEEKQDDRIIHIVWFSIDKELYLITLFAHQSYIGDAVSYMYFHISFPFV